MNRRHWPFFAFALLICLLVFAAAGLADAGNFGGDSDWGGGDWDSDWDSDWGGGDWDSDWGGGDWDSDWGGGGVGGIILFDGSGGGSDLLVVVVVVLIIALYVLRRSRGGKRAGRRNGSGGGACRAPAEPAGLPLSVLKEKDPNFNEQALLERVGNLYVQMQMAWQAKDWEPMRAFLTDALFNQMAHQLEELKAQGLTNCVERIAVLDAFISRYYQEGDDDVLVIRLSTRICDYTIRDDTGELVRGSRTRELFMTYDWKMTRSQAFTTPDASGMSSVNCPNCGAPLSVRASGRCEYCGTVVTLADHDWALSAIRGVSQRSRD